VFSGKTPKGIEADDAPKPLKTLTKKITRRGMLLLTHNFEIKSTLR
jgi:hypothetical protein